MSNILFTSDMHLFHPLVTRLRGFGEDIAEHNNQLIKRWHSVVKPDDTVWVLGDLTCTSKKNVVDDALGIIDRLPGTKHFIWGNHDAGHPMHKQAWKEQGKFLEVFASAQAFAKISVQGKPVLLSHFPYKFDHTNDARYTQWRLPDEGVTLLHGHTHASEKVTSSRELHVGLDSWDLTPVSFKTVEDFVLGKPV